MIDGIMLPKTEASIVMTSFEYLILVILVLAFRWLGLCAKNGCITAGTAKSLKDSSSPWSAFVAD